MSATTLVLLLSLLYHVCYCDSHTDADLTDSYQFRQQLHERYIMYWSFDSEMMTVSFAVRVQTTGWIGFGLSPNGQMPGSDVVIGWVNDNGDSFFNVRIHAYTYTCAIQSYTACSTTCTCIPVVLLLNSIG